MKKYVYILLLVCVAGTVASISSSCRKVVPAPYDATQQAKTDEDAILDYFLLNDISDTSVTRDPSGLYYHIDNPGTGAHPTATSSVVVNYVGTYLDDTIFETQTSYYFSLPAIDIQAFTIGLSKIGKGGTITMYVPSGLGFGQLGGSSGVPAPNANLIYHMTLQGFTN